MLFKDYITEVPDFPEEGVNFKDISPLLANNEVLSEVINRMGALIIDVSEDASGPRASRGRKPPDYWIGIDSRGFLFASALAFHWGGGVVMCRKEGKLPPPVTRKRYQLEYGTEWIEMKEGTGTAVIVDDVFATGGTLQATNDLAKMVGYDVIDNLVLIDLQYLPRVEDFNLEVRSLIQYE